MRLIRGTPLILLLTVGPACQTGPTTLAPVFLEIVVEADPGVGLSDVPIRVDAEEVGRTGPKGTLRTPILTEPGRVLRVEHDCPVGHGAPPAPAAVKMRRYDTNRPPPIQVKLACKPLTRVAAFVIRAKNGPGLPVRVNGELVATTNGSGVAHFSKSGPAGTEYLVELDAGDRPTLLPHSAETSVKLSDANELFIIAPSFRLADRAGKHRPRRRRIIKIE